MLKRLWDDGLSASQIAAELGAGTSRNAVIGKVHRLGFPQRGSAATTARRINEAEGVKKYRGSSVRIIRRSNNVAGINAVRRRASKPSRQEPPIIVSQAPSLDIPFIDTRSNECRWIEGEPTFDAATCGQAVKDGHSWCPYHCSIVYQPPAARLKRTLDGAIQRHEKAAEKHEYFGNGYVRGEAEAA